ncbi:hypothetical protein, partial [Rothia kristinae]|uniref:hypothetical protein n=1 Tax=Rothia kristinae TaxID=37923 RepID=UPI0022E31F63
METENYDTAPKLGSLLFPPSIDGIGRPPKANNALSSDALHDLGLEGFDAALAKRVAPRLQEVFRIPLPAPDAVQYRHEVFTDLANPGLHERGCSAGLNPPASSS